jgi:hypothetical protein
LGPPDWHLRLFRVIRWHQTNPCEIEKPPHAFFSGPALLENLPERGNGITVTALAFSCAELCEEERALGKYPSKRLRTGAIVVAALVANKGQKGTKKLIIGNRFRRKSLYYQHVKW